MVNDGGTALTLAGCSDVGEGVESLSSESSAMDQTLRPLDVLAGPVGVRWPDEMRRIVASGRDHALAADAADRD